MSKEPLIGTVSEPADKPDGKLSQDALDAIEALVALGYDKKDAKASVLKIEHLEELNTNEILKLSLQYMF